MDMSTEFESWYIIVIVLHFKLLNFRPYIEQIISDMIRNIELYTIRIVL